MPVSFSSIGAQTARQRMSRWAPLVRMGLGALRHRVRGTVAPLNVMISLTDACTSNCGYCAIPERATPAMDTARLLDLLTELRAAGTCRVGLWGGEPLLQDDLGLLIAHAKKLGLWVSVVSNGDLVPSRIDQIRGLDHLLLSLDGAQDAHDAQRAPGSHRRVLAALSAAKHAQIPTWTLSVLTARSLPDVPYLVDLAQSRGHRAAFQVLHHAEALDGGLGQDLHPAPDALRDMLLWLRRSKKAGRPIANSVWQLDQLLAWPQLDQPAPVHDPASPPCLGGQLFANIDTDGSVYPCSLLIGRPEAPSVRGRAAADVLREVAAPDCNRCTATAFTEYNGLLRLRTDVVAAWVMGMVR